ncbi:MAG: hypothetical protein U0470_03900 [Anaerolineae bacterium]
MPSPRTSLDGPIDAAGEDWVRFTFAPLPESAGRWWTARLALRADRGAPPSVHVVGVAADAFADGYAVVDDAIVTGWSPAFRLWAAPPSATADILPEPAAEALLGALALVAVATADAERREAAVAAAWPVRAARWLARANAPLPPIDRRPWPPEAPALVKALGTLRHYGPLALARELRAMARWRRMDPAARAAARDQNTCVEIRQRRQHPPPVQRGVRGRDVDVNAIGDVVPLPRGPHLDLERVDALLRRDGRLQQREELLVGAGDHDDREQAGERVVRFEERDLRRLVERTAEVAAGRPFVRVNDLVRSGRAVGRRRRGVVVLLRIGHER